MAEIDCIQEVCAFIALVALVKEEFKCATEALLASPLHWRHRMVYLVVVTRGCGHH
jgi:hypothetical protein